MRFFVTALVISIYSFAELQAGLGIQAGGFSPNKGLDDHDNALLVGANLSFKFALFGFKAEAFFLDSSGKYQDLIDDRFGTAEIEIKNMVALDFLYYPAASTFFLQAGINYMDLNSNNLDLDLEDIEAFDIIDKEFGYEAGIGVIILDKLLLQGKILYTPNALESSAVSTFRNLDQNFSGILITAGWQF